MIDTELIRAIGVALMPKKCLGCRSVTRGAAMEYGAFSGDCEVEELL